MHTGARRRRSLVRVRVCKTCKHVVQAEKIQVLALTHSRTCIHAHTGSVTHTGGYGEHGEAHTTQDPVCKQCRGHQHPVGQPQRQTTQPLCRAAGESLGVFLWVCVVFLCWMACRCSAHTPKRMQNTTAHTDMLARQHCVFRTRYAHKTQQTQACKGTACRMGQCSFYVHTKHASVQTSAHTATELTRVCCHPHRTT